jgi:hypothetical protein
MSERELQDEFDADSEIRTLLGSANGAAPPARHDQAVLASAGRGAWRIRARHAFELLRLRIAVPLLASFALGASVTFLLNRSLPPTPTDPKVTEQLRIPIRVASRDAGAPSREIPVEQADPQVWYRYIQELIYAGDRVEAERHLHRFNQLHPDFTYRP